MLILIAMFVLLMVLGFADGPTGGGEVAPAEPAVDEGGGEDTSEASLEELIDSSERELAGEPPPQEAAPVTPEPPQPDEHQQILEQFLFENPGAIDPAMRAPLAQAVQAWWQQKYVPHATQLRDAWLQMQEMQQSDQWRAAQYFSQNPEAWQQVQQWWAAQQNPQMQQQYPPQYPQQQQNPLAGLNPEEMTPTERALYSGIGTAYGQLEQMGQAYSAAQQQMAALQDYAGKMYEWAQQNERYHQQVADVDKGNQIKASWNSALGKMESELGFSPMLYGQEMQKAIDHAKVLIAGRRALDGNANLDYESILREGLRHAGFYEIKERRAKQAASAAPPPGDRRGGSKVGPRGLDELVSESMSELGMPTR